MILADAFLERFTFDAAEIDRRLRKRITPWELFALLIALFLTGAYIWVHVTLRFEPFDLVNYLNAGRGDFSYYYYAYWLVPIFTLLGKLPVMVVYGLWGVLNVLSILFAARVFGGRSALALIAFQTLYVVFIGQIVGVVLGALALLWWGMAHRRWHVAGLGLILAASKLQLGVLMGLFLWALAPLRWREKLRVLAVPLMVAAASLVLYPGWPQQLLHTMRSNPANDWGSIALWRWIGPWALLLWIPPLLLPMERGKRLVALTACMALALPYFQQTDLLALFVMPIGWLPVAMGNLGLLFFFIYWDALQMLAVVPLLVYVWVILREGFRWVGSRRRRRAPP